MIIDNNRFTSEDIYIDYNNEEVMFRSEHQSKKYFRKFYGETKETEVAFDNNLLNEAIRFGLEITRKEYFEVKLPKNKENTTNKRVIGSK